MGVGHAHPKGKGLGSCSKKAQKTNPFPRKTRSKVPEMNIMSNLPSFYPQTPVLDQERLNSIGPLENQQCRVCDEPAAGFHFGAFTCEGCKSFFGRSCNNQTVIQECRNNYQCIIDKKNRTACKACRLRKCLMVGMSKSGCRYGRRSNWFKIHSCPSPPPPPPPHPMLDMASLCRLSPLFAANLANP